MPAVEPDPEIVIVTLILTSLAADTGKIVALLRTYIGTDEFPNVLYNFDADLADADDRTEFLRKNPPAADHAKNDTNA